MEARVEVGVEARVEAARVEARVESGGASGGASGGGAYILGTPSGIASLRVAHATDGSPVTSSSSHTSSCRCEPESYAKTVPGGFCPTPDDIDSKWRTVTSSK